MRVWVSLYIKCCYVKPDRQIRNYPYDYREIHCRKGSKIDGSPIDRYRITDRPPTNGVPVTSGEGGRVRKANACKSNVREARVTRRDVGGRLTSENRSAPPDTAHAPYLKERTPALASPIESPSARAATPPIPPLSL